MKPTNDDPKVTVNHNNVDQAIKELSYKLKNGRIAATLKRRHDNPSVQSRRRSKRIETARRQKRRSFLMKKR